MTPLTAMVLGLVLLGIIAASEARRRREKAAPVIAPSPSEE